MYNAIIVIPIVILFILLLVGWRNILVCRFRLKIIDFEFDKKMALPNEHRYSGFKILNSIPSYNRMLLSLSRFKKFLPNDIRDEFLEWERKNIKNARI